MAGRRAWSRTLGADGRMDETLTVEQEEGYSWECYFLIRPDTM